MASVWRADVLARGAHTSAHHCRKAHVFCAHRGPTGGEGRRRAHAGAGLGGARVCTPGVAVSPAVERAVRRVGVHLAAPFDAKLSGLGVVGDHAHVRILRFVACSGTGFVDFRVRTRPHRVVHRGSSTRGRPHGVVHRGSSTGGHRAPSFTTRTVFVSSAERRRRK